MRGTSRGVRGGVAWDVGAVVVLERQTCVAMGGELLVRGGRALESLVGGVGWCGRRAGLAPAKTEQAPVEPAVAHAGNGRGSRGHGCAMSVSESREVAVERGGGEAPHRGFVP